MTNLIATVQYFKNLGMHLLNEHKTESPFKFCTVCSSDIAMRGPKTTLFVPTL